MSSRRSIPGPSRAFSGSRAWKAIENRVSGEWSLYDLASDPQETADLAAVEDSLLSGLQAELLDWAESLPLATHAAGAVSPEEMESLRALGYVN